MSDEPKFDLRINEPLDAPQLPEPALQRPPIKGVQQRDADRSDEEPVAKKKFTTLTEMAEEVEFFTTALVLTAGKFDRDPVALFNAQYPTDEPELLPFTIDYAEPLFEGLGATTMGGQIVDWNRRLYGIRRERFEALRNMIASLAICDRKNRFYARIAFYEMTIVDPTKLKKMVVVDKLPEIPITIFAVCSNLHKSLLQKRPYPKLPIPFNLPAEEPLLREADAVLGPPASPEALLPRSEA